MGIPHTRLNGFGEAIIDQGVEKGDIEKYMGALGSRGWEIVNLDFCELDSRGSFTGVAKREKT